MKNLKKILLVALCAVAACLMLAGCGNSKFIGTWKTVAIEENGEKYTKSDETYGDMVKDFLTLEIEKGGEGTAKSYDEDDEDFEWEVDGDTITITVDGDDQDFKLKDDQLVANIEGIKIYLEKDD